MSSLLSWSPADPAESLKPTRTVATGTPTATPKEPISPNSMTDVPCDLGSKGVARSRMYLSNAVSSMNSVKLVGNPASFGLSTGPL